MELASFEEMQNLEAEDSLGLWILHSEVKPDLEELRDLCIHSAIDIVFSSESNDGGQLEGWFEDVCFNKEEFLPSTYRPISPVLLLDRWNPLHSIERAHPTLLTVTHCPSPYDRSLLCSMQIDKVPLLGHYKGGTDDDREFLSDLLKCAHKTRKGWLTFAGSVGWGLDMREDLFQPDNNYNEVPDCYLVWQRGPKSGF